MLLDRHIFFIHSDSLFSSFIRIHCYFTYQELDGHEVWELVDGEHLESEQCAMHHAHFQRTIWDGRPWWLL